MEGGMCMMELPTKRTNLDTTKSYTKTQIVNGTVVEEEVGTFVRSYTMGAQVFWEFMKEGKLTTIVDQIVGSVNGNGPIHFRESDYYKN